jgi:hypothetical protein
MKGELANRFSEILKLKFASTLDFEDFKQQSEFFNYRFWVVTQMILSVF